ncbi:ABC transporter permease subunit [Streptomyces rapamycinicus]|uniref:ABC transporter permease subunit n=1 Tax=Streptomyces rapamycinicus TaxID=1226757 RepID=UPI0020C96166|nr:hypothetical protein [Streptomyces rapamycinicus]
MRRTRLGGQMLTIRANERAAAAAGINIAGVKLTGFGIAAGLAGTAGVLLGYQQKSLAFQNFDVFVSLTYVAVVYLAGISRVSGAVIAGLMVPAGWCTTRSTAGWNSASTTRSSARSDCSSPW